jgi:membrane-bound lytic murein transglycosylase D
MVTRRFGLPVAVLFCAACASTTPSPKLNPPPATSLAGPSAATEAEAFGSALHDAYTQSLERESTPQPAAAADLEAAVSMAIPDHRLVRSAVNLFTSDMRGDIQTYLTRSARYKAMIDKALVEAGLPKGLAYLPVIESGYTPTLTSRAGARGVWQFMSETAREYGLRVDWWVDERADPERSTLAAAQYLKDLYRQFNDWPLTLAAYNAGPGRIRRALDESGGGSFWDLCERNAIPKETRGYVPTFYATLLIATDPATYGFHLGSAPLEDLKRIDVDGPLSLKYLAEASGVDEALVRELNPALRRAIVPPGRAAVRLPAKGAARIAARAAVLKSEDADVAICAFTLRSGDSLKDLAHAIGTSVDAILAMNGLRSPSQVYEGSSLYLPVKARDLGILLAHNMDQDLFYAVRKGDTLYSIAKKHGLTVDELRDLNDLDEGDTVHAGQKVRVSAPRTMTAGGM